MKSAPMHPSEAARLAALFGYNVLDTEAEEVFDEITELASEICGTPMSMISLVDANRQWFKSKVGYEGESTDRKVAFCAHAILQDEVFEVVDATKDERFHDSPLVMNDPKVKFYAGAPLVTPDGLPVGALCVLSSESKKLTSQQRRALKILSRQVITQLELRAKTKTLEKSNQFKTEFLSNISHELRTPLNAIVGFSDLLLATSDELLPNAEAKSFVESIDYSGKHLLEIVNSILDMGKIEAGKMQLNPHEFHVEQSLRNIVDMLSVKAAEKGVTLRLRVGDLKGTHVTLDEKKLTQIVINVVGNAIKFTARGDSVDVHFETSDRGLRISVVDEGCGMSEKELACIFDKYKQVANHNNGGTGLGMSITKGLIDLMHGEIEVKSEKGAGTSVIIQLPTPLTTVGLPKDAAPSVLVVEDNPVNQRLVRAMLERLDMAVTIAGSGEEALDLSASKTYDCILMDINLPGMTGIEATKALRERAVETPIIALTADVFVTDENRKLFFEYLTKPVTIGCMRETLGKIFPRLAS